MHNQYRPVTVNDTLAEYPRPENWQPTGNYISVSNSAKNDSFNDIFGQFSNSSGGGGAEDSDGNPEDSDPEAEDSRKTYG
ncbi:MULTISPECIES: hypothetical protein [Moorena]|uniref:Uncharacterized protein n=1 Tax=Moorena producens 3L TaxID=489825 RepID=F4Y2K2_9CYAN|nr:MULTISPECIES: hypothetical protein [Moorena]NEQ13755.1 hypothetical protein [Moorena sp. SIO3E2]NES80651.1 hypothetical protein [Moorena sp. SIO2B7]EGJ28846.1 hypothetical protein LYNGBM3L_70560 [Moorena producens 3L]NEP35505.1 hypothetical protein [Moorena sp. SIO3B2]NEP65622.1 hypothetical protein [Moorena sp. SIO3A5]